jgi:alkylation response protein AidB-like acyl-CoA dehydrogenase
VRFRFDDQQRGIQSAARTLLTRECPPSTVRAEFDGAPRAAQRWLRLAEMGAVGMLLPERWGGMGLDEIDLVLLLEETGRFALPDPLVETALVAAPLLSEAAVPAVQERWLPAIAAGAVRVAVRLPGAGGYVVDADSADLLLLHHEDALHLVAPEDVRMVAQPWLDAGRGCFAVEWTPRSATALGAAADAEAIAAAVDRGVFGVAAQLLGLTERMIEMAAEHARQREQFGRPIGSFQAVKHLLANALLGLEFARPAVYRAAWSLATRSPDRARDVSMAKVYASDAALAAGRAALQIHGALGYTWAHDLHIWMKRSWVLANGWGGIAWHRDRVAQWLLGPAPNAATTPAGSEAG